MQNWTGCSTLAEHQTVALTDNRDGNTYTVAKLKDGNCWMTSNLALNLADFAGTTKLNTKNTDLLSNTTNNSALKVCQSGDSCYVSGETNYYWNPSASMFEVAQTAVTADPSKYANAADGTYGVARSTLIDNAADYGLTYNASAEEGSKFTVTDASKFLSHFVTQQNYFYVASEYRLGTIQAAQFHSGDQYGDDWNWDGGTTDDVSTPRSYYGEENDSSYYKWISAVAESSNENPRTDSICPLGWKFPNTGDSSTNKTWAYMFDHESSLSDISYLLKKPISIAMSGIYDATGRVRYRGSSVFFWASESATDTKANSVKIGYSSGLSLTRHDKWQGFNIRCIKE